MIYVISTDGEGRRAPVPRRPAATTRRKRRCRNIDPSSATHPYNSTAWFESSTVWASEPWAPICIRRATALGSAASFCSLGRFSSSRSRPTNQSWPRLYVERGNELTEPSYMFEYVDIDKLELAFELTFGKIAWT
jgi:hypothetical protein